MHRDPSEMAITMGNKTYFNVSHPGFKTPSTVSWNTGHESLHHLGFTDGPGLRAYKFGTYREQQLFYNLPQLDPERALRNPDTIIDYTR